MSPLQDLRDHRTAYDRPDVLQGQSGDRTIRIFACVRKGVCPFCGKKVVPREFALYSENYKGFFIINTCMLPGSHI